MKKSKLLKSCLFALIGIFDILVLADNLVGIYLFTAEPDDEIPMSFFYIPLVFSVIMLAAAIASIIRICKGKPNAAVTGFFVQLWLAWMTLAFLMISVELPEVFVLLSVLGLLMLGIALYIRRNFKKKSCPLITKKKEIQPFQMEKAEYCWDAAAEEYCLLHGIDTDKLTDYDNEKIYEYSGLWLGYFMCWIIKNDFQSDEFVQIYGSERTADVKSEKIRPYELIAELDYRIARSDFSEKILRFIDHYFPDTYFEDYSEFVSGYPVTYCINFNADVQTKLEKRLGEQYRKYMIQWEEFEIERSCCISSSRKVHWSLMNTDLDLLVSDGVSEEYVKSCTEHLNSMPDAMLDKICEIISEEVLDRGIVDTDHAEDRKCLKQYRPDRMIIYTPYGDEPAYCIGGEADFEEEHGFAFCIRGKRILMSGYRRDVEFTSPWYSQLEEKEQ